MAEGKMKYQGWNQKNLRIQIIGRSFAPHEDVYHWIMQRSWLQFFGVCVGTFTIFNAIFACLYMLEPDDIANARSQNFEDSFYFSVQTFATIGYGYMAPISRWSNMLVVVESFVGIFSTAVVTGAAFARLARVDAKVLFTERLVVAPRNGVPHLQIRVANWRHNNVAEAQLRVSLLVSEHTTEGELMRRPVDIPLVRDRTDLFRLSWTAMHRIDASSPFWGPDAVAKLKTLNAEIFVNFVGQDETLGQTIHARHMYRIDDIVWNARFADVLHIRPDGVRQLDYADFHRVVQLEKPLTWEPPAS
jgi:inward rectifier potassium channel